MDEERTVEFRREPAASPRAPQPARQLPQLEQARLDNRDAWRSAGIASLVLLVIGIGIPVIPLVLIYTLLATRRNERDARAGVYGQVPQSNIDEKAMNRWIIAAAIFGFGVFVAVGIGTVIGYLMGAVIAAGGVAVLHPWRGLPRVRDPQGRQ